MFLQWTQGSGNSVLADGLNFPEVPKFGGFFDSPEIYFDELISPYNLSSNHLGPQLWVKVKVITKKLGLHKYKMNLLKNKKNYNSLIITCLMSKNLYKCRIDVIK